MSGSSKKSNIALLTEGQAYIQRAKKARKEQVEEIKFDDEARSEWLTGFSKRKKAKLEERRARAKERDRQAHLEERRKARQELKERAAANVKSVRAAMGLVDDDDDDSGSEAGPSKVAAPVEEAEYSDGDQLATVTITEDFDPSSSSFRPLAGASSSSPPPASASSRPAIPDMPASSHKAQTKAKKERERLKEKKKSENDRSRSMETKSERKKGREFEAKRRAKKAGMALERDGRRPRGMKAKGKGGGKRR